MLVLWADRSPGWRLRTILKKDKEKSGFEREDSAGRGGRISGRERRIDVFLRLQKIHLKLWSS